MIKYVVKLIQCKFKGHTLTDAGSCPFTGRTYNVCTKCGKTTQA